MTPQPTARPVSECVANNPDFWCDGEEDCPEGGDEAATLCDDNGGVDDDAGGDAGGPDADFCEFVSCSQNGVPEFCPVRCATTTAATTSTGSPPTSAPSPPPTTAAPSGGETNPEPAYCEFLSCGDPGVDTVCPATCSGPGETEDTDPVYCAQLDCGQASVPEICPALCRDWVAATSEQPATTAAADLSMSLDELGSGGSGSGDEEAAGTGEPTLTPTPTPTSIPTPTPTPAPSDGPSDPTYCAVLLVTTTCDADGVRAFCPISCGTTASTVATTTQAPTPGPTPAPTAAPSDSAPLDPDYCAFLLVSTTCEGAGVREYCPATCDRSTASPELATDGGDNSESGSGDEASPSTTTPSTTTPELVTDGPGEVESGSGDEATPSTTPLAPTTSEPTTTEPTPSPTPAPSDAAGDPEYCSQLSCASPEVLTICPVTCTTDASTTTAAAELNEATDSVGSGDDEATTTTAAPSTSYPTSSPTLSPTETEADPTYCAQLDCSSPAVVQVCPTTCAVVLTPSTTTAPAELTTDADGDDGSGSGEGPVTTTVATTAETTAALCTAELEFTCHDGSCIPSYRMCDGKIDCDGAEDETDVRCETTETPIASTTAPVELTTDADDGSGSGEDTEATTTTVDTTISATTSSATTSEPLVDTTVENGCSDHSHCGAAEYCNSADRCFACMPMCSLSNDARSGLTGCAEHCNPATTTVSTTTVSTTTAPAELTTDADDGSGSGEDPATTTVATTAETTAALCTAGLEFTCHDGSCIPSYQMCDGEIDCDGAEDETDVRCETTETPSTTPGDNSTSTEAAITTTLAADLTTTSTVVTTTSVDLTTEDLTTEEGSGEGSPSTEAPISSTTSAADLTTGDEGTPFTTSLAPISSTTEDATSTTTARATSSTAADLIVVVVLEFDFEAILIEGTTTVFGAVVDSALDDEYGIGAHVTAIEQGSVVVTIETDNTQERDTLTALIASGGFIISWGGEQVPGVLPGSCPAGFVAVPQLPSDDEPETVCREVDLDFGSSLTITTSTAGDGPMFVPTQFGLQESSGYQAIGIVTDSAAGSLTAILPPLSQSQRVQITAEAPQPDHIEALLLTQSTFVDDRVVRVKVQLRSSATWTTNVQARNIRLTATPNEALQGLRRQTQTETSRCHPDAHGICLATFALHAAWFSADAAVSGHVNMSCSFEDGSAEQAIGPVQVSVARAVSAAEVDSLFVQLPSKILYPDDEFELEIRSRFEQYVETFEITVDTADGVQIVSGASPRAGNADVFNGAFSINSVTQRSASSSYNRVARISDDQEDGPTDEVLLRVRMRVLPSATASSEQLVSVTMDRLTENSGNQLQPATDTIMRHRSGVSTGGSATLHVGTDDAVGFLATADSAEIFNLMSITGLEQTMQIRGDAYSARGTASSATDALSCSPTETDILSVSEDCLVSFTGDENSGSAQADVEIQGPAGTRIVPLRVLFPGSVIVTTSHARVRAVAGWFDEATDASCGRFKYQPVSVTATVSYGDGAVDLGQVDVTTQVRWTTSNAAVLTVSPDGSIEAITAGSSNVGIQGRASQVRIEVENDALAVIGLDAIHASRVQVQVDTASPEAHSAFTATATVIQPELRFEGDETTVIVSAVLEDHSRVPLLTSMGLVLESLLPEAIEVVSQLNTQRVRVPQSPQGGSGELLHVSWNPNQQCGESTAVAQTNLELTVNPPAATAMQVSINNGVLVPTNGAAAAAGYRSSAALSVALVFPGRTQNNLAADPRTSYSVTRLVGAEESFSISDQGRITTSNAGMNQTGVYRVDVVFEGQNVTASAEVTVINFRAMEVQAVPFPAYPGSNAVPVSSLSLISGVTPEQYQQARLLLRLHMTNDDTRLVNNGVSFAAAVEPQAGATAQLSSVGANRVLTVSGDGMATVSAVFAGVGSTQNLAVTVAGSDPVRVDRILDLRLVDGDSEQSTFAKGRRQTGQVTLGIELSDGRKIPDAVSSTGEMRLPGLLRFASSEPSVLDMDTTTGQVTLLNNHHEQVTVTVTVPGETVSSNTIQTWCNLLPVRVGDVDLVQNGGRGPPVQALAVGSTGRLDVKVNTGGQTLGAFQIQVEYDSQGIEVTEVEYSVGAADGTVDEVTSIRVEGDQGVVRLTGTVQNSRLRGTVRLATITFRALTEGLHQVSGAVISLENNAISPQVIVEEQDFEAGNVAIAVTSSRRQMRSDTDVHRVATGQAAWIRRSTAAGREHRRQDECSDPSDVVDGDMDCSCRFTAGDSLYIHNFIAGRRQNFQVTGGDVLQGNAQRCPHTLGSMDADMSGNITAADAAFLLGVLDGRFFFVRTSLQASTDSETCATSMISAITGPDGVPDTVTVHYVISRATGDGDVAGSSTVVGTAVNADNTFFEAVRDQDRFHVDLLTEASFDGVGVSVLVAVTLPDQTYGRLYTGNPSTSAGLTDPFSVSLPTPGSGGSLTVRSVGTGGYHARTSFSTNPGTVDCKYSAGLCDAPGSCQEGSNMEGTCTLEDESECVCVDPPCVTRSPNTPALTTTASTSAAPSGTAPASASPSPAPSASPTDSPASSAPSSSPSTTYPTSAGETYTPTRSPSSRPTPNPTTGVPTPQAQSDPCPVGYADTRDTRPNGRSFQGTVSSADCMLECDGTLGCTGFRHDGVNCQVYTGSETRDCGNWRCCSPETVSDGTTSVAFGTSESTTGTAPTAENATTTFESSTTGTTGTAPTAENATTTVERSTTGTTGTAPTAENATTTVESTSITSNSVEITSTTALEILLDQSVDANKEDDADEVSTAQMVLVLALLCLILGIAAAIVVLRNMRKKDERAANSAKTATTDNFGWSDSQNGKVGGPNIWNRGLGNVNYDDFPAENDGAQEYVEFADEVLSFPEPSMFDRTPIPSQHHAPGGCVSTIDIDTHTDAAEGANIRSGVMSSTSSEDVEGYLDVAEDGEAWSPYGATEIDVDEHLDESETAMTDSGASTSRLAYVPMRSSDQLPSGSGDVSSQWTDFLSEPYADEWVPTGIQLTPVAAKGDKRGSQQGARPVQVLPTRRGSHKAGSNPAVYATVSRAGRNTVSMVLDVAEGRKRLPLVEPGRIECHVSRSHVAMVFHGVLSCRAWLTLRRTTRSSLHHKRPSTASPCRERTSRRRPNTTWHRVATCTAWLPVAVCRLGNQKLAGHFEFALRLY